MTVVFLGRVLSTNLDEATFLDLNTKETVTCRVESGDVQHIKTGDEGVFGGDFYQGRVTVKRIHLRKYLDPMYEEDVITASGEFALLKPIDDPFHKAFAQFLKEQESVKEANTHSETE